MDFVIDNHTSLPPHAQIQEQIKLALLLGQLRPGDTLPSIRDVEKQFGISRNLVRKAYLELQSLGILNLHHGKGVVVDRKIYYGENGDVGKKCETLSREFISQLRQMGVLPTAFARYLYQQSREDQRKRPFIIYVDAETNQAKQRAAEISSVWRLTVPGISIDDLARMEPSLMRNIRKILTSYLRYDQVLSLVGKEPEVIPLGLTFERTTVKEFAEIPKNSSVVFVIDDSDYPSLSLILEAYRKLLLHPSIKIESLPLSQIPDIDVFVKSKNFHKVIFSNRVWPALPERIKKKEKVTRPHMSVDLGSLESVRIRAGVIV